MKPRIGRLQRAVRRAFIASGGKPLLTRDLLAWTCPREDWYPQARYRSLARAAPKFAIKVGRSEHDRGRPWLWAPKPEVAAWIKGETDQL